VGYVRIDIVIRNDIISPIQNIITKKYSKDRSMDKYSFISVAPSLVIVAAMIIGTVVGIATLKKVIAKDAAAAEE
jgi:hypothetical protein